MIIHKFTIILVLAAWIFITWLQCQETNIINAVIVSSMFTSMIMFIPATLLEIWFHIFDSADKKKENRRS